PDPDSQPRWARPARPRRSTGAKRQPDDHAGHQADAERHGDRLPRVMSDHVLGHLEALAGLAGPLTVLVAEPVAGLLRVVAYGLGRLRDGRRRVRGQVAEEPLDHLAALTRLLLDPTDELVDVPPVDLEVVVGELAPLLLDAAAERVPLALQLLHVDR